MSETFQVALISALFGLGGVVIGLVVNSWLETAKARRERTREVRLRLVGERIQTSEVMEFVKSQRRRQWPRFWKHEQPDLSKTNLQEVDLRRENLHGVKLFRANLKNADLDEVNLRTADSSKADLSEATLIAAKLSGANLIGATLSGANLIAADLSEADLSGADLSEAVLSEANLTGAKISDDQLVQVRFLARATMPDGTRHK